MKDYGYKTNSNISSQELNLMDQIELEIKQNPSEAFNSI